MKNRIFSNEYACPCMAKKDMEESDDIYKFLKDFYNEMDSCDWNRFNLEELECAHCLFSSAITLFKTNEKKYNESAITTVTKAKHQTTEVFLEKTLDWLRQRMTKLS